MKRPVGVTLIALLHFVVAIAWFILCALASWELVTEFLGASARGVAFRIFLVGWFLLCASLFLMAGSGLWHLRRWALPFVTTLATLISAALLVDFYRWTNSWGRDFITQWDVFVFTSREAVLVPYNLVIWPIWASIGYFFHEVPYFTLVIVSYFLGGLGYVSVARYLLSDRAKQAFRAAP